MNRVSIVAAVALTALATPATVIAAPADQTGAVQQTSVTEEPTSELAGNYVPSDGEFVFDSVKLTGNEHQYGYTVSIPDGYRAHGIAFYIEHADGATEKIMRTVPREDGAFMTVWTDVEGEAVVTSVVDLWNKSSFSIREVDPAYEEQWVSSLYESFSSGMEISLGKAQNENISVEVLSENPQATFEVDGSTPVISPISRIEGTDSFLHYAESYRPPYGEGQCLGSFTYNFIQMKSSVYEDWGHPTTGFSFKVDPKYAGMDAEVYFDLGRPYVSNDYSVRNELVCHKLRISDDGTFTVPFGYLEPITSGDQSGNLHEIYFQTPDSNQESSSGLLYSGRITVNLIATQTFDNGVAVDYNRNPETILLDNAEASIEEASAPVDIIRFDPRPNGSATGYEPPTQGGEFAGYFELDAAAYKQGVDRGYITFKIDLGKEYAGRTATTYSGTQIAPSYVDNIRSYIVDEEGCFYVTESLPCNLIEQKNPYTATKAYSQYFCFINIEPAEAVSIAGATVSEIPDQTWTGSPATPRPTVELDGKVLAEGTDYELSYEDNDAPGTASVTITGKGAYSGSIRVEFEIVERGGDPSGPTDPSDPDEPDDPSDPNGPAPSFPDVPEGTWYHDAVTRAAQLGVMNGYSGSGLFGPLDWLTREQAAAVMFNYLGEGDLAAPPAPHRDVLNDWYTDAVNWAVAEGVMGGYAGSDLFGIGRTLTREEFCAVIANAAGADLDAASAAALDRFADGVSVSDWARPAVAWAVEAGIMNGVEMEDGSRELQATRGLVRAEMAAMTVSAIDAGVLGK